MNSTPQAKPFITSESKPTPFDKPVEFCKYALAANETVFVEYKVLGVLNDSGAHAEVIQCVANGKKGVICYESDTVGNLEALPNVCAQFNSVSRNLCLQITQSIEKTPLPWKVEASFVSVRV